MPTLEFKGKQFIYTHHLSVPFRTLEIDATKSLTGDDPPNLDGNLIIHGDNLHALKALLPTYAGKVKCIYIDPPYNTGNEGWCYSDRVNAPLMREWIKREANPVDKEDLERHDKWLCMMWPRLQLLKDLLSDEGAIWISIDDNEKTNLIGLCNEIFGDNNFVACLTIRANPRGRQSDTNFATVHDYLVCYAKKKTLLELNGLPLTEEDIEDFDHVDPDGEHWRELGLRQRGSASLRDERPDMYFPIYVNPLNGNVSLEKTTEYLIEVLPKKSDGRDGRWMWGPTKVNDEIGRVYGRMVSGRDEFDIFIKDYLHRPNGIRTSKPKTIWAGKEVNTETGGKLLKDIIGKKVFDYPKPLGLIEKIIQITAAANEIVLDSFAGSGTTAHAVLALNREDSGNRRFILVEMEDYADQVTAERVRRIAKGISKTKNEALKNGLGGSFAYCTLGDEINITSLLKGDSLPSYEALARYVFFTATGKTLDALPKRRPDWLIGETDIYSVHLIYQPDREFLRGQEAALNAEMVDILVGGKGKKASKKILVFAAVKFMGQKELTERNIEFCQLPYAIHRILGA